MDRPDPRGYPFMDMHGLCAMSGALTALLLAACSDGGSYRLVIRYPDQAALDRAARVELVVDDDVGCAELLARTDAPDNGFAAHGETPALGRVPFGLNAFLARVRDDGCLAFAQGCTEAEIAPQTDATVRIALAYVAAEPCRSDEQCSAGSCLRVDASSDAAIGDSAPNDGATGDSEPADRASPDQTTIDSALRDSGNDDRPASDGAGTDRTACDTGCGTDAGGDRDAASNDTAVADSTQPDTFVPCTLGARRCSDGRTLAICESPPTETFYPCATSCDAPSAQCWTYAPSNLPDLALPDPGSEVDLIITSDTVIDTDRYTIGGFGIPHTVVVQDAPAPEITVFKIRSLDIGNAATVRVIGARALAIAAILDVSVAGVIDVSATGTVWHQANLPGAGGFAGGALGSPGLGPCPGLIGQGTSTSHIHSTGSGGGGHGGSGGSGGLETSEPAFVTGSGGSSCGRPDLIPLQGGSGGAGQVLIPLRNPAPDHQGLGGGGGGAIQISAGRTLTIAASGKIVAAGGGGGESSNGGGAGGGAGGAILLEASTLTLASGAVLAANGGGGACGDCT